MKRAPLGRSFFHFQHTKRLVSASVRFRFWLDSFGVRDNRRWEFLRGWALERTFVAFGIFAVIATVLSVAVLATTSLAAVLSAVATAFAVTV